ncbi:MAG TPA: DegT/DnrJ/EryC1/StrS family aminotransferase, partial [Nitrososphaerales archaeon]|nr:DegT/DnrJ/EryC1/StrS family aminotransferase [Nitrososphaerales archaeon]
LKSLGVKEGDEVILPAVSCHSVADSIIQSGATPVLAEVNKSDGTIDPDQLSACISDRTKAIIAIHYLGLPCDVSEIMEKADPRNITVVGDCAQALGSKYGQSGIGTRTPLSFFSFGPDKHLCFGSGGMLAVNSSEMFDRVDQAAPKAREGSGESAYELLGRSLVHRKPAYGLGTIIKTPAFGLGYLRKKEDVSFKLEAMSKMASSYGLRHIRDMDRSNRLRVENAKFVEESVRRSRAVGAIDHDPKKDPVFLKYTVLAENRSQRLRLMKALKRRGIEAGPLNWRHPLHRWGSYPDRCRRRTSLKGADEFADRFLNLPCHPRMSAGDLVKISQTLALF